MDEPLSDVSISTRVVLGVTLTVLTVVVTVVNLIVWMVMRLIPARNAILKHCHITIILANLITAVFAFPALILNIALGHWPLGMPMCIFTITVNSVAFVIVMWFITVLMMDRVLKSNFRGIYLTLKKHSRVFHLLIWVILLVLTLPFFVAEFVKQSHKFGNTRSGFHCHVLLDAAAALLLIIFGYAGPVTIAGMMMTFLWFRIIKENLIRRKKISAVNGFKYAINCDSRAMTPWGSNWLNGIETRVRMGPNNALPALRRHSIGECEPEMTTDLTHYTGNERRNSLPKQITELHTTSRKRSHTERQYYSSSENSWIRMASKIRSDKPPLDGSHSERGSGITGCGSSDKLKAKSVKQNKQGQKTCEKISQNRVSYDLSSPRHQGQAWKNVRSNLSTNQKKDDPNDHQQRAADSNFTVNQIKDDLSLPGSVQITEPVQDAAVTKSDENSETTPASVQTGKPDQETIRTNLDETSETQMGKPDELITGTRSDESCDTNALPELSGKPDKQISDTKLDTPSQTQANQPTAGKSSDQNNQTKTSSAARQQTQCPTGHIESSPEYQNKHNLWVRGSQAEDNSPFGYDDSDDDFDDSDEELRVCKVLTIMVVINIILWLPMISIYGHRSLCDTCQVSLTVWTVVKIIGQVTLITNPVSLLLTNKQWRPLLKYILSGFGSFTFQCLHRW